MPALPLRRLGSLALALLVGLGLLAVTPQPADAASSAQLESTFVTMTLDATTSIVLSDTPPLAEITLSVAGDGVPDGDVVLLVDGVATVTRKARRTTWINVPLDTVGTHSLTARYLGSATQAPSETEAPVIHTVLMADSVIQFSRGGDDFETTPDDYIPFEVLPQGSGAVPAQQVTVSENGVELGRVTLDSRYGEFPLSDVPLGKHTLTFAYPGDDNIQASDANVTVTIAKQQPSVEATLQLDRPTAYVGSAPIAVTVSLEQVLGEPVELTGDISVYRDDELVATRPAKSAPITVEVPVGGLGGHEIRAVLEETESYPSYEVRAPYQVGKAPTRIVVDASHPYRRSDLLEIFVESDGTPVDTGTITVPDGERTLFLDLENGKVEVPLRDLPSITTGQELHYVADELHEPAYSRIKLQVLADVGDTWINASIDNTAPVIGRDTVAATIWAVKVEGGATPRGTIRLDPMFGFGTTSEFDVSQLPKTVMLPAERVGEGTVVSFIPSQSGLRGSSVDLDYRVRAASTQTRVHAPQTPLAAGDRLPVSVAAPDSSATPAGRVLVTDGEPADCQLPDPFEHPYDPHTCANELTVLELEDGESELVLPSLAPGRHDLVFWFFPMPDGHGHYPTTARSRISVPVTVSEAPRPVLSVDRESAVVRGTAVSVTATLDGAPDAEGEIAFLVDGTSYAARSAGAEPVSVKLPIDSVGSHSVTASYTGSERGEGPRSAAVGYTVVKAATATTIVPVAGAAPGVLDVTVSATGSDAVPSGRVQIVEGTTTVALVDLTDGVGRFVPRRLLGGTHDLVFRYVGDHSTEASMADRSIDLPAVATSTRLSLDRARTTAGASTTMTAEVTTTDTDPAAGTVTFLVDGRAIASAPLTNGRAQMPLTDIAVGTRTVMARFAASPAYAASTSAPQQLVIARAPATIRAKARLLRTGRLRVVATISSAAAIAGKVQILQKVRILRAHSKPRTRIVRLAAAKLRRTGTHLTITLRTRKPRTAVRTVLIRYAGSATVAAAERSVRVPRRR